VELFKKAIDQLSCFSKWWTHQDLVARRGRSGEHRCRGRTAGARALSPTRRQVGERLPVTAVVERVHHIGTLEFWHSLSSDMIIWAKKR